MAGAAGALAAVSALVMWGAAPASAGGPTSVLLVAPGSSEATGLYYADERYKELEGLIDSTRSGTARTPDAADLTHARQINVTWMIHDITPYRLDQVFPVLGGEDVWIRTSDLPDSVSGYWHRAPAPTQLRALLTELGVMGPVSDEGSGGAGRDLLEGDTAETGAGSTAETGAGGTPESASAAAAPAPRGSGASPDAGTNWWWTLPGAAAGGALALALRPPIARRWADRAQAEPGPRQELLDV
ncbi:hypothetical protein [Streptomyces sp. NPDC018693]|uniref:hypothetical protein n=1 Tax=unclassified Streptomyces TaxID=2593676 RepID=UPI00378FE9D2